MTDSYRVIASLERGIALTKMRQIRCPQHLGPTFSFSSLALTLIQRRADEIAITPGLATGTNVGTSENSTPPVPETRCRARGQ